MTQLVKHEEGLEIFMESQDKQILKHVLKSTLYHYRANFLIFAVMTVIFLVLAVLYGWEIEPVIYAAVLCLFLGFFVFSAHVAKEHKRALERQRVLKAIAEEWQNLPEADSLEEADYQAMVLTLGRRLSDASALREEEQRELIDYFTVWVHQIKTPIAVIHLLLNREDSELSRSMDSEIFRIEQYVEMALNYTRLGSDTNDLVIREYDLDELIRQAIRKYAGQFIGRKIRVNYEPVDVRILTDKKWFLSILEQLLSNAVKYTPQGSVTITAEKSRLSVTDTGIGIDPADLPRIFEKGYTGMNGREEHRSTGMGLYLCKKAADKLSIQLKAESTPGVGSTFTLEFPETEKWGMRE